MSLHEQDGFTVVELLIALVIIALTTTTLLSALEFARNVSIPVGGKRDKLEEIALLYRLMTEQLAQVTPAKDGTASLRGAEGNLSVLTRTPRLLPFLPAPVQLSLQPVADGAGLAAFWRSEPAIGSALTHRLIRQDRHVRFGYFAPGTGWLSIWSDRLRLPALVRIQISEASASAFDLIVPVRATEDPLCAVQSRTKSCGLVR